MQEHVALVDVPKVRVSTADLRGPDEHVFGIYGFVGPADIILAIQAILRRVLQDPVVLELSLGVVGTGL
jgi:hypothetical protein